MKKVIRRVLIFVAICGLCSMAYLGGALYTQYRQNTQREAEPETLRIEVAEATDSTRLTVEKPEEEETPRPLVVEVEEEYWESVNADITLEMLKNSGLVYQMTLVSSNTPVAKVGVALDAYVIAISGRTLILEADPPLQIYIGENVIIHLLVGPTRRVATFSDIKVGDRVGISGELQYGVGYPFRPNYLGIAR